MDRIRLFISIVARNALFDKYNKNRMQSVGQWERKIGWNLSNHESHQITSANTNAIKLFKIGCNCPIITESEGAHAQSVVHSDEICSDCFRSIVSIPLHDCRAKFLNREVKISLRQRVREQQLKIAVDFVTLL